MGTVAVVVLVAVLVVLMVRGLWRATAVQKGTGCPCCDKVLGHDHDQADHEAKPAAEAKAPAAKP